MTYSISQYQGNIVTHDVEQIRAIHEVCEQLSEYQPFINLIQRELDPRDIRTISASLSSEGALLLTVTTHRGEQTFNVEDGDSTIREATRFLLYPNKEKKPTFAASGSKSGSASPLSQRTEGNNPSGQDVLIETIRELARAQIALTQTLAQAITTENRYLLDKLLQRAPVPTETTNANPSPLFVDLLNRVNQLSERLNAVASGEPTSPEAPLTEQTPPHVLKVDAAIQTEEENEPAVPTAQPSVDTLSNFANSHTNVEEELKPPIVSPEVLEFQQIFKASKKRTPPFTPSLTTIEESEEEEEPIALPESSLPQMSFEELERARLEKTEEELEREFEAALGALEEEPRSASPLNLEEEEPQTIVLDPEEYEPLQVFEEKPRDLSSLDALNEWAKNLRNLKLDEPEFD